MEKKRIGILILFIGIVVLVLGFLMRRTEETFESDGKVTKIIVNENESGVKIRKSKDDKVRVIYREGKGLSYNVKEEEGIINVSNEAIKFSVGLSLEDESVIIEIPKDYNKELVVNTVKKCKFVDEDAEKIKFSKKEINEDVKK